MVTHAGHQNPPALTRRDINEDLENKIANEHCTITAKKVTMSVRGNEVKKL